ncbi:PREDICTED: telomere repeat-binding protein 4-like [Nicotiana attenuata]|uniref:Telomere repeat-binding protein 4 n=1 Tax=Nicotiana attenuata TaxID=49451 RepID=A0A314L6W1_NICAT|nr:PREDICTED: telomere repeat-binding protein 4-like [Nicotiana attenuata]XP_019263201.1 PREDICTED: telomere repeat-binding protein 4-like [Nicotiana attenuata]OIT37295.1 telomere repeat-binding protein 4 [Nicotiana attenuata]
MSSKKRLNYGFSGYQFPVIPKAPRSVRRRHSHNNLDNNQICAFELLAAVAGELLQESESSACSNAAEGKDELADCRVGVKCEQLKEDKAVKSECFSQGSCVESTYIPEPAALEQNLKHSLDKPNHVENNIFHKHNCSIMNADFSQKDWSCAKLENCKKVDRGGMFHSEVEGRSSNLGNACNKKIETVTQKQLDDDRKQTDDLTVANSCSVKGPIVEHVNNNATINSDNSVQFPLYRAVPKPSFGKQRNNVKLGIRDDDENSFRSYSHSSKIRAFRKTSRIGYRRIKRILTSRHWKIAPQLKDCERSCFNNRVKSFYQNRKRICALERCRVEIPSKRRKMSHYNSDVAYDQQASSERKSNSPEKGIKRDIIPHRGSGASASAKNHQKKDPCVKFSIKSFNIPELFIEVPETETVGSLKRSVMEAVRSILGNGLRVGVVLEGKKVRDDNRTLQQAGVSQNGNLDTLGFTLEPSFYPVSPSLLSKDPPASSPCVADHELTRRPPSPILELELPSASSDPSKTKLDKHDEDYHELAQSPTNPIDPTSDVAIPDSRAVVIIPHLNAEALAVVPGSPKNSRSELSQRRIRRPFSVAEVEALVEAVEQLGTGRWRDVKIRAFEYADHRTYVDVKDKWKTLVHTASITPQQRRGEPVPQELLDRVLAAHAYWSQQHGKQHAEALKMADSQVQNVGA